MMRARLLLLSCALCAACGRSEEGPPKEPAPAPTAGEAIPVGPLSGKLAGEVFTVHAARYYVDQRPGYEKVDIKLYAAKAATSCGDLAEKKSTSVWLRRKGSKPVEPGTFATNVADGGEWEVHYQAQQDARWRGYGEANALFVVTAVDPDLKLHGELSACFRDPSGSCVAGRFTAHLCRISIDAPVRGAENMERRPKTPLPAAPKAAGSAAPDEEGRE
jgi:hypothetical protein